MGKGYLDAFALEVDDGVESRRGHVVVEQVLQSVAADDAVAVVVNGQPGVQISIVAQHGFHEFAAESEVQEEPVVGFEADVSSVFFLSFGGFIAYQITALEYGFMCLPVAHTAGYEALAQGIDGFQSHAVQSDAGREYRGVVLGARIQFRYGLHQTAQGNPPAIVTDGSRAVVLYVYVDTFAKAFVEFVNAVVDGFLEQHVNAVFGV